MPNETELRAFGRLEREGAVARSQVPASLRKSSAYGTLVGAGILREEGKGNGYLVRVTDPEAFTKYLDVCYPGRHDPRETTAAGNVSRYRNSKAGRTTSAPVVLLRGTAPVTLNGRTFDLAAATRSFGCASCLHPAIQTDRICLVENLSTFLRAEELLGAGWTFLHTYGRLGKHTFRELGCNHLLHFGDYDYTGLEEYLRLKESFPEAKLYCPENLMPLWDKYSIPLKRGVSKTKRVGESREPVVIRIRELLTTTNRFLEQQALFIGKTLDL